MSLKSARKTLRTVLVLVLLGSLSVAAADAPDPAMLEQFKSAMAQVKALKEQKKVPEAIGVCEAFLRRYPSSGWHTEQAVARVFSLLYTPEGKTLGAATYRRGLSQFAQCPAYYSSCAAGLAGQMVWGAPGVPRAPEKALQLIQDTLKTLGDRFPKGFYYSYRLLGFRIQALRMAGKAKEAFDAIPETAESYPGMIHSPAFLLPVVNCAKLDEDPKKRIEAAKLYWVLCDFTDPEVNHATEIVARALSGIGGPGLARQFANAQQDPKAPNPLCDYALYPIGDPDKMLEAAGDDPVARFNAFLVAGRIRDALEIAKTQLRKAADDNPGLMPAALRSFARCFKAADLNVIRANQFLEYQRTGEGENPLLEFEADLEHAKPAPAEK